MPYEFNNSLYWDLVLRQSYQAKPQPVSGDNPRIVREYVPIPNISLPLDSPIVAIGIKSESANPWWKFGGWASMQLLTLPSSTSEFVALLEDSEARKYCRLGRLTLIRFPRLDLIPYLLLLEIPYYFEQAYVEVWKYSGPDPALEPDVEINLSE